MLKFSRIVMPLWTACYPLAILVSFLDPINHSPDDLPNVFAMIGGFWCFVIWIGFAQCSAISDCFGDDGKMRKDADF